MQSKNREGETVKTCIRFSTKTEQLLRKRMGENSIEKGIEHLLRAIFNQAQRGLSGKSGPDQ